MMMSVFGIYVSIENVGLTKNKTMRMMMILNEISNAIYVFCDNFVNVTLTGNRILNEIWKTMMMMMMMNVIWNEMVLMILH